MSIDQSKISPIDARIAMERLIVSDGWKIYISLLEQYANEKKPILFMLDQNLSALKYNDKDIALNTLYTIDDMTNMPVSYIEQLSTVVGDEDNIEKTVELGLTNVMNEAQEYVKEHKVI